MKGVRAVEICIFVVLLGWFVGVVYCSPMEHAGVEQQQQRGVGGVGFPSFFYDIKHQFGSIGHDLRKLVTSLMGATQVVYWKHPPVKRTATPVRRADYTRRQNSLARHPPRVQPTKRQRRKKAYTGDDYDDFFSFDSLGLW